MKAFILLAVGAILVGVGGVFAGCSSSSEKVASEDTSVIASFPTPTRSLATQAPTAASQRSTEQVQEERTERSGPGQSVEEPDPEELARLRDRLQSGDITPDELAALRESFQRAGGRGGSDAGRGLLGEIESIDGDRLTISTTQGPLLATVGPDTAILITSDGSLENLKTGMSVQVNGERGEGGGLHADAISVTPEDEDGQFGGRFRAFRQGQDQGGQSQAAERGGFGGQSGGGSDVFRQAQGEGGGGPGGQSGGGFGGFRQGQAQSGFGGQRGLRGTIESIEDNGLTLETSQGPLRVSIGSDTVIRITSEGGMEDLATAMRVFVSGQRDEAGDIAASSIVVVPGDVDGFFGGRGAEPFGGIQQ